MIIAPLLNLFNNYNKKKKFIDKDVDNSPNLAMHQTQNIVANNVAIYASEMREIVNDSEKEYFVLNNIVFSSSGSGKYQLIKNNTVLATLFSNKYNRNPTYTGEVEVFSGDSISVYFENIDTYPCAFYVGFNIKE